MVELRLYGAMNNCSSCKQSIGIDIKLAISAAYLGGCCLTEEVVLLRTDKFEKGRWILCWFIRACSSVADVCDMMIFIVVSAV